MSSSTSGKSEILTGHGSEKPSILGTRKKIDRDLINFENSCNSIRPFVSPDPVATDADILLPFSHSSGEDLDYDSDSAAFNIEAPDHIEAGWDYGASDPEDEASDRRMSQM